MINSHDYSHICSDSDYLEKSLPGRTIQKLDFVEGEIYFTDGSVLTFTWQEDFVGLELFEEPVNPDE